MQYFFLKMLRFPTKKLNVLAVRSGEKTLELRLNKSPENRVLEGEQVILQSMTHACSVEILHIFKYISVDEVLRNHDFTMFVPGCSSADEAKELASTYMDMNYQEGYLVWEIKYLNDCRPVWQR